MGKSTRSVASARNSTTGHAVVPGRAVITVNWTPCIPDTATYGAMAVAEWSSLFHNWQDYKLPRTILSARAVFPWLPQPVYCILVLLTILCYLGLTYGQLMKIISIISKKKKEKKKRSSTRTVGLAQNNSVTIETMMYKYL